MPPSTWPDPQRGGEPLNPKVDGAHWLELIGPRGPSGKLFIVDWHAGTNSPPSLPKWSPLIGPNPLPENVARDHHYHGPVRTDADLATTASVHEAAGFKAGVMAAAKWHEAEAEAFNALADKEPSPRRSLQIRKIANRHTDYARDTRALPIPNASALEAVIKEAEARGAAKEREACLAEFLGRVACAPDRAGTTPIAPTRGRTLSEVITAIRARATLGKETA